MPTCFGCRLRIQSTLVVISMSALKRKMLSRLFTNSFSMRKWPAHKAYALMVAWPNRNVGKQNGGTSTSLTLTLTSQAEFFFSCYCCRRCSLSSPSAVSVPPTLSCQVLSVCSIPPFITRLYLRQCLQSLPDQTKIFGFPPTTPYAGCRTANTPSSISSLLVSSPATFGFGSSQRKKRQHRRKRRPLLNWSSGHRLNPRQMQHIP
jgi:hypothetical protein